MPAFSLANHKYSISVVSIIRFLLAALMLVYAIGILVHLIAGSSSASSYDNMISSSARRHALPPGLIKAVIRQESKFRPWAAGHAGEIGLMQITRRAVTDWENHTGRRCEYNGMLRNPRLNIEIGSWYLGRAFDRWLEYRDAEALALAEYNAGRSSALKWAPDDKRESVLPRVSFPSTREYIKSVLEYRREYID